MNHSTPEVTTQRTSTFCCTNIEATVSINEERNFIQGRLSRLFAFLLIIGLSVSGYSQCFIQEKAISAPDTLFCPDSVFVEMDTSDYDVRYYLRYDVDNSVIHGPIVGNGFPLTFMAGEVNNTTAFNVFAEKSSGGLTFDGVNDHGSTPTKIDLFNGLTYEAWIKTTNMDSTSAFGSNSSNTIIGDTTNNVWNSFGIHGGKVRYVHYDGAWQNVISNAMVSDGMWHHVAVTHNQLTDSISIYIDGNLDNTGGIAYGGGGGSVKVGFTTIGASYMSPSGSADFFDGMMDEVRVWNIERSGSEITNNKDNCSLSMDSTLVAYYQFEDVTGFTLSDLSPDANDVTLHGMDGAAWGEGSMTCGCTITMSNNPTVSVVPMNTYSIGVQDETSNGGCDGRATFVVNGGDAPHSFNWSSGNTTDTDTMLCAGMHFVTITDNKGCMAVDSVEIMSSLSAFSTSTDVNCGGACDGVGDVYVSGGQMPYIFNWSMGATTQNVPGLCAGAYQVTVTDNISNQVVVNVTITEPTPLTSYVTGVVDESGPSNCDGAATFNVTGGIAPYIYQWSNGQTNNTDTMLCVGTYDITITDANGCEIHDFVDINTANSGMTSTASITDANCGNCDGSISLSLTGGQTPYNYMWSTASTASTITGLCAGVYNFTVTDTGGDTLFGSENVMDNFTSAYLDMYDQSGPGMCDGIIHINVTGGTSPFTYNWSNGNTQQYDSTLCEGSYDVTVTDSNGCQYMDGGYVGTYYPPQNDFSWGNTCEGDSTEFWPSFADAMAVQSAYWTFGDGDSSMLQNPTHMYDSSGNYNVMFFVTDTNMVTDTVIRMVDIYYCAPPQNYINFGSTCFGDTTDFWVGYADQGNVQSVSWDFGDGNTSTSHNTSNFFAAEGDYNITLIVTDTNAVQDTVTTLLNIYNCPEPSNDFYWGQTCVNRGVDFNPNFLDPNNVQSVEWLFGDGGSSISMNPIYTYSDTGNYQVSMITTDTSNVMDTVVNTIYIYDCPPISDFWISGGCYPDSISFGSDSNPNIVHQWDFDGQGTSGDTYPMFAFADTGYYNVMHIATDTVQGITDTTIQSINYFECPPLSEFGWNGCYPDSLYFQGTGDSQVQHQWDFAGQGMSTDPYPAFAFADTGMFAVTHIAIDSMGGVSDTTTYMVHYYECGPQSSPAEFGYNGACLPDSMEFFADDDPWVFHTWDFDGQGTSTLAMPKFAFSDTGHYNVMHAINDTLNNLIDTVWQTVHYEHCGGGIFISTVDLMCAGDCNGSATVDSIHEATPPIVYQWSNGATTQSVSGLCAGVYTVTLTDDSANSGIETIEIFEPGMMILSLSTIDASAPGATDGSASVDGVTWGASPYSYMWSNGSTNSSISGIPSGAYQIDVTDANGCSVADSVAVGDGSNPSSITITSSIINESCPGNCDGSADLTLVGGSTPYSFMWNNGATIEDVSTLCAGQYFVTVTDNAGDTAYASVNIGSPGMMNLTVTTSDVSTQGGADGAASVVVSGGISPFSYNWSNGSTGSSISGVPAGTYQIDVTDGNGCDVSDSIVINDGMPTSSITITSTTTDESCFNNCDGSADLTLTGGTAPYSFIWNIGETTEDIAGVCGGTYTVTVTDNAGDTAYASVTVNSPTMMNLSITSSDVSTQGGSDGSASVVVSGGVTPYSYNWSNGSTSSAISNVTAGTYQIDVNDGNGCSVTQLIAINDGTPDSLSVSISSTNVNCNAGCDGSASLSVTGGASPYTYAWSDSSTVSIASALCAGTYFVTITDNNSATAIEQVIITEPTMINPTGSHVDETAQGNCDGSVTMSVSNGGVSPYTYQWDSNAMNQTAATAVGLCAGTYFCTITDANGCTVVDSDAVGSPAPGLSATVTESNAIMCNGSCDAEADAMVTGGFAPYTYQWSNGDSSNIAQNLCAGVYSVTISDNDSVPSTIVQSVTITEPTAVMTSVSSTDETMLGACDGSASVMASGGTAPYTYYWDNADTQSSADSLCEGTIGVLVYDDNGCSEEDSVMINAGTPPTVFVTASSVDVMCNGGTNGEVSVMASGGMSPYTYSWNNGSNLAVVVGVGAGTYVVTVTDNNNSTAVDTVVVGEPTVLSFSMSSTNASTQGACDGMASADMVLGGTTPYTYNWSSGGSNQTETGLCPGYVSIDITDANSCMLSDSVEVIEGITPLTVTPASTDIDCYEACDGTASVAVTGGATPYSYEWSNGSLSASLSGICAGTYQYTVTGANAAVSTGSVTINQNSAMVVVPSVTASTCGNANGSASIVVTGGVSPYSYNWPTGSTTNSVTQVSSGPRAVTITDDNGCVKIKNIMIQDTDGPTVSISSVVDANCGGADGQIYSNVTGGTPPYNFLWDDGTTYANTLNAEAGDNTLLVTDANGCAGSATATVNTNGTNPPIVKGNVTSAFNGFTVTNGTVTIYSPNPYGGPMNPIASAPINANGNYVFNSVVPIGEYLLIAEADTTIPLFENMIPTYFGLTYIWDSASAVGVVCDSIYTADIEVIDLTPLSGTNTFGGIIQWDGTNKNGSRAGDPIPGIGISLEQIPGGIIAFTETDDNGEFEFDKVPASDSSYTIYVDLPGLAMEESYIIDVSAEDTTIDNLNFLAGDSVVYIDAVTGYRKISVEGTSKMSVFPNPFSNETNLFYQVRNQSNVRLEVYNLVGERVLVEDYGNKIPGSYSVKLSSSDLENANGVYIVKMIIGNDVHTTRIIENR